MGQVFRLSRLNDRISTIGGALSTCVIFLFCKNGSVHVALFRFRLPAVRSDGSSFLCFLRSLRIPPCQQQNKHGIAKGNVVNYCL